MSDFEGRLGRALGEAAESAPDGCGLADGARVRARRRRTRRTAFGAAAAVVAVAVPTAVLTSGSGPADRGSDPPPVAGTDAVVDVGQRVTCDGGDGWEVATMDGGLTGVLDDAEVRASFADVLAEAPLDAPTAIRERGVEEVPYIVLADDGDSYTLGIGSWSIEGPGRGGTRAGLERQGDGSLRMASWGDCELTNVLPEGRSPVEVSAPDGGVDPGTTSPVVLVREVDCTSGRDPGPFLGEPAVTEDGNLVRVSLTSETLRRGANCLGNPTVPLTLSLDEPLGDRVLLDAGTYPPTPIEVAQTVVGDDGWRTVTYEGDDPTDRSGAGRVLVDLPPGWERLDTSACELVLPRYGPPEVDPCGYGTNVTFLGSATYDSCCSPGLVDGADDTEGDGFVGDLVGYVAAPDHATARRVLASLRSPGEQAPSSTWRTVAGAGFEVDVPDDGSATAELVRLSGVERLPSRSAGRDPEGTWTALVTRDSGAAVRVTAPTQALADLVASTVRDAG